MQAPKCRVCGKVAWSHVCEAVVSSKPENLRHSEPVSPAVSPETLPVGTNTTEMSPPVGTNTERDRKRRWRAANPERYRDYQRTYMAKRRALSTSE